MCVWVGGVRFVRFDYPLVRGHLSMMKKAVRIQATPMRNDAMQKSMERLLSLRASSMKPSSNLVRALKARPSAITPVGKKSNTASALIHRQSLMRRGAFGLYFWRRLTVFMVLARDTRDTPDWAASVLPAMLAWLVYNGLVGRICGYSLQTNSNILFKKFEHNFATMKKKTPTTVGYLRSARGRRRDRRLVVQLDWLVLHHTAATRDYRARTSGAWHAVSQVGVVVVASEAADADAARRSDCAAQLRGVQARARRIVGAAI